ncbi:MAG: A24 family peptidase [Lachnospiraceae bacterium]|nr:A24 family peptidase [Lachnospiraceae bacterium]
MDIPPVPNAVSLIVTAALSVKDIRTRRIPGKAVFWFLGTGILYAVLSGSVNNIVLSAMPGAFILSAALVTGEKIGCGDGFVIMALGIWIGFRSLITVLAAGFMLSGLYGLLWYVIGWKKSMYHQRDREIPFVPFLFFGLIVREFFGGVL